MKSKYVENVCAMFRRKGLTHKYEHPGIYCIKISGWIVYIGKSRNMLKRIAAHYVGIKQRSAEKYRILAELQDQGFNVDFDVLYYAKEKWNQEIDEEIGQKEGEFIRAYTPPLNTQIPKEEDWHKYENTNSDPRAIIKQLLDDLSSDRA